MWNELLNHHEHRPYPLPRGPWIMRMRWTDLLFAHWPVPVDAIRPLVPSGLEIDTFDGSAWFTITPLQMSSVAPRYFPDLPGVSAFPQLNVRTYVNTGGKPGIWFFSIDAADVLAVIGARKVFHLPYTRSLVKVGNQESAITFASTRRDPYFPPANLQATWYPDGDPQPPAKGSFDEWLIERYCLYSANRGGTLFRGEIHHVPMPLQPARVQIDENSMHRAAGLQLPPAEPLAHYASRLDVIAWAPRRVC